MEAIVLSDKQQSFNGVVYYLCGDYFQKKGKRLHRAVWEYHNGEIPKGYHIHHVDGNKANNNIDNLVCIKGTEHLTHHMSQPEVVQKSRISIDKARISACKWHSSEAGKVFHSQLSKENWSKRGVRTYECTHCGKEYETKHIYGKAQNHFCSGKCKAAYGRIKRSEG